MYADQNAEASGNHLISEMAEGTWEIGAGRRMKENLSQILTVKFQLAMKGSSLF